MFHQELQACVGVKALRADVVHDVHTHVLRHDWRKGHVRDTAEKAAHASTPELLLAMSHVIVFETEYSSTPVQDVASLYEAFSTLETAVCLCFEHLSEAPNLASAPPYPRTRSVEREIPTVRETQQVLHRHGRMEAFDGILRGHGRAHA